jgi:hypothetical protein
MSSKTVAAKAEAIISRYSLKKYLDVLLDYWEVHPTTLGHGFLHVLKVAVNANEVGENNLYKNSEDLFIGSLFHDIYRPAEGKVGEEDQRQGAIITEQLFKENKFSQELTAKVKAMILSHDDWRGSKEPPQFDLLISVADKISHDPGIAYHYAWASNKFSKKNTGKPVYYNHLIPLYGFVKYQQRAWEVFMKHPINGTEKAIQSYLRIYRTIADNYLADPEGKNFFAYIDKLADEYRREEIELLRYFGRTEASIKKITERYYE